MCPQRVRWHPGCQPFSCTSSKRGLSAGVCNQHILLPSPPGASAAVTPLEADLSCTFQVSAPLLSSPAQCSLAPLVAGELKPHNHYLLCEFPQPSHHTRHMDLDHVSAIHAFHCTGWFLLTYIPVRYGIIASVRIRPVFPLFLLFLFFWPCSMGVWMVSSPTGGTSTLPALEMQDPTTESSKEVLDTHSCF